MPLTWKLGLNALCKSCKGREVKTGSWEFKAFSREVGGFLGLKICQFWGDKARFFGVAVVFPGWKKATIVLIKYLIWTPSPNKYINKQTNQRPRDSKDLEAQRQGGGGTGEVYVGGGEFTSYSFFSFCFKCNFCYFILLRTSFKLAVMLLCVLFDLKFP